jgi:hypothetical protein
MILSGCLDLIMRLPSTVDFPLPVAPMTLLTMVNVDDEHARPDRPTQLRPCYLLIPADILEHLEKELN